MPWRNIAILMTLAFLGVIALYEEFPPKCERSVVETTYWLPATAQQL